MLYTTSLSYGSRFDYVNFKFISFITRSSTNQLYYSKGYRTTKIDELFCVTGYSNSVFNLSLKMKTKIKLQN
jgi:hypothetical protein